MKDCPVVDKLLQIASNLLADFKDAVWESLNKACGAKQVILSKVSALIYL